jgi:hypothetical protein
VTFQTQDAGNNRAVEAALTLRTPREQANPATLPICLLLDGLFAGGPTFARCQDRRWKYLVVLQEGDLASVHQEFDALTKLAPE